MKNLLLIITVAFILFTMSCKHQEKKIIFQDVTVEHVFEDTENIEEPPPPSAVCLNPVPLKNCFVKICSTEKPVKDSLRYRFILFETNNCYSIGLKTLGLGSTKKDSTTFDKFYSLSKVEYKNLAWKEVLNKIKFQLKEFCKTTEFENSSLAKAKSITIIFDDRDLLILK